MSRRHAASLVSSALLLSLLACSSSDDATTDSLGAQFSRSGSRLQVRGYEADGMFFLDGLWDTKLNMMCVPAIASDGVERCVPRNVRPLGPYADAIDAGPDYLDACRTPIVTIAKTECADAAKVFIRRPSYSGEGRGADYWRIGASIAPPTIFYPAMSECLERSPDPAYAYFERGEAFAPTDFVAFSRHDLPVSSALRAVVLEGEDGSRIRTENDFVDVARGKPCELALAEDDQKRCLPVSANLYQGIGYADADCHTAAAFTRGDCVAGIGACDDSSVTQPIGPGANVCAGDRSRFYAAGPSVSSNEIRFSPQPGECTDPIKQQGPIVEVGPVLAPASFPSVAVGTESAHSRLVERTLVVGDAAVRQSAVFDPQIDDECTFEKAADGKVRCLPAHAAATNGLFADPACTTPALVGDGCQPAPPKYARVVDGAACDPVVRIHAVVPATHVFSRSSDGSCSEFAGSSGLFVAGAEVPATTFVEGSLVTR